MIQHDKVTGYPLDNMVHFGEMLMDLAKRQPREERVVWKSDVAEAYRILPMHPRWQITVLYSPPHCLAGLWRSPVTVRWSPLSPVKVRWTPVEVR